MMTIAQIVQAVGPLAVHGIPDVRATVRRVSTDTRTIGEGDLFVALTGENFDGHAFVKDAVKAGAMAAVVSNAWFMENSRVRIPLIVVASPLDAFGAIARAWRRRFQIPVVCVAGSNGKTTTKELVAGVLAEKFTVLKTPENFNNLVGVPQTLLMLTPKHEVAVIEIGTNHPGEIAKLCRVAEPTHGVITNIGREHLQFFRTVEGVARENGDLFAWLAAHGGTAFVNLDEPLVKQQAELRGVQKRVEFGMGSRTAAVRGSRAPHGPHGEAAFAFAAGARKTTVSMHLIGEHVIGNALAAAAVGVELGVPAAKVRAALEAFTPDASHAYGRMRVEKIALDGGRGRTVTVLNDTYNANPDSMYAALESLFGVKTRGRHVAVLGDMIELGDASRREHEALGAWLLDTDIDEVVLTGSEMAACYESVKSHRTLDLAPKRGAKKRQRVKTHDIAASYFPANAKEELVRVLRMTLHDGDVVLVKGSRGMRMEDVVVALRAVPARKGK